MLDIFPKESFYCAAKDGQDQPMQGRWMMDKAGLIGSEGVNIIGIDSGPVAYSWPPILPHTVAENPPFQSKESIIKRSEESITFHSFSILLPKNQVNIYTRGINKHSQSTSTARTISCSSYRVTLAGQKLSIQYFVFGRIDASEDNH